jgi:hypothetical protein
VTGIPRIANYKSVSSHFIGKEEMEDNIYPTIIPNWDHTPRSGFNGYVLNNSTPELFRFHVRKALATTLQKRADNMIVFLKSWNEWGEGNYMEPDLKYGKKYIETLKQELDKFTL